MQSTKNSTTFTYPEIIPIADMGILIRFVSESECLAFYNLFEVNHKNWIIDIVPAYKALAIYHNPKLISIQCIIETVKTILETATPQNNLISGKLIEVPCCYELGADLEKVAQIKNLTTKEVIRFHSESEYCVYAIGFTPGFPYLGYLPKELTGVPRLATPRIKVPAGSIGLTGVQTGIYPEEKPGGWHLIGQTPCLLVDLLSDYFAFKIGDKIRFFPINKTSFKKLLGSKLL